MFFINLIIASQLFLTIRAFVPLSIENQLLSIFNKNNVLNKASETITHEEIIRIGILKSVIKYLSEQDQFSHINVPEFDLSKKTITDDIYYEFYKRHFCLIGLNPLLKEKFQKNVAIVDFDRNTRNFPYAHFDSEALIESNRRVIDFTEQILDSLHTKDYNTARKLSGQILHTIQDFYSHSNWIEMGNTNRINTLIGTEEFETYQLEMQIPQSQSDTDTCAQNCTKVILKCADLNLKELDDVSQTGYKAQALKCPLVYHKCEGNIIVLDKLVSGYFDGQLPDGTKVLKPVNSLKCSHGGIFDSSSSRPAEGGINKDSGYFIISPHADLHLKAAYLAIEHTEYFFNEIRARIGDKEFSKFLRLDPHDEFINKICFLNTNESKTLYSSFGLLTFSLLFSKYF